MNDTPDTPVVTTKHYQALAGLALAAAFMLQLQQCPSGLMLHLLMLLIGALGILNYFRFSTSVVLFAFAAAHLYEQYNLVRFAGGTRFQFLNLAEVMLCMALLTYMIAQYRLDGMRFGVLPDTRPNAAPKRSETSLTTSELAALIFPVPLCALAGQVAMLALSSDWGPAGMGPRSRQLVLVFWTLLVLLFMAAHAFRHWKRLQMSRSLALVMLHDILWRETRGEQRRIERWAAWRKLKS
jgi:hypothetical protein